MLIRRATDRDIPSLVELRRAMWDEMKPTAPADASLLVATGQYLRDELPTERVRAWVAVADERPVGMALLLVHEHPPRIRGREFRGYVTAVYMAPEHRRQGHAAALMRAIVEHAQAQSFRRLILRTSDAGRSVYLGVGFEPMEVLAQDF